MKILASIRETAKIQHATAPSGHAQRVTFDPVPDPGDATVDGYVGRQFQLVITNEEDYLPASMNPGDQVALSVRIWEPDAEE